MHRQWVEGDAAIVGQMTFDQAHLSGFRVDLDLDRLRGKGIGGRDVAAHLRIHVSTQ
jgi:hypothetical protein